MTGKTLTLVWKNPVKNLQRSSSNSDLSVVQTLPNANDLAIYTYCGVMLKMLARFDLAYKNNAAQLDVYLNRTLGRLEYDDLLNNNDPDYKPSSLPIFTFNFQKPFADQFPIDFIRRVKSIEDVLSAFEEIEFTRGNVTADAEMSAGSLGRALQSIIESPFSEKFQQLERTYAEARDSTEHQFCYIYLNDQDELAYVTLSAVNSIESVSRTLGNIRILGAFDLHEDFENQMRANDFDPTQSVTWEDLMYYPADCIRHKAQRLLPAPTTKLPSTVVPFRRSP